MTISRGFTLVELLLVLAIIALASALLVPRINSDSKLFDAQVRDLVAVLKYSRRMAVVSNQVRQAVLHPYVEGQSSANKLTAQGNNKKNGDWFSKGAEFVWQSGDKLNEIKNKKVVIDFFPQGGATEGELLIYVEDLQSKIIVDGFTGKITLKDIDNNEG